MAGEFNIELNVDLANSESIDRAMRLLEELPFKTEVAIRLAVDELAWRIEDRLRTELDAFGLGDSRLSSGIKITQESDGLSVSVASDHMMFVEFGTGIIGASNPHPNPSFADVTWSYDTNNRGQKGWWYPTTSSDPNPTKKFDKSKQQWFAWTAGQVSKPFMYNTWRYARRITTRIFNKHLKKVVK